MGIDRRFSFFVGESLCRRGEGDEEWQGGPSWTQFGGLCGPLLSLMDVDPDRPDYHEPGCHQLSKLLISFVY